MSTATPLKTRLLEHLDLQALKAAFTGVISRHSADADRKKSLMTEVLRDFSWPIEVEDWTGQRYRVGGDKEHCGVGQRQHLRQFL